LTPDRESLKKAVGNIGTTKPTDMGPHKRDTIETGGKKFTRLVIHPVKQYLSHQGYYYPPLIFSLVSYIALYHIPGQNVWVYRFVQCTIFAILLGLILFASRNKRLPESMFWTWYLPNILLYTFFSLGSCIVLMSGLGLMNTIGFIVHLVIALLISSRLVGLSVVVIGSIALVINDLFSFSVDLAIPFQIGYWLLILSSLYISFLRYNHTKKMMRSKKLWRKYVRRSKNTTSY
jgi:hypothetical protein